MSCCRWSSDNWRCDLYCYGHCDGGYTTHVASNRVVGDIPMEPSFELPLDPEWGEKHNAVMDFLKYAKRAPIGLPHDGETFSDPDLPSFLARLEYLRSVGYSFPDYVLDDVRAEDTMNLLGYCPGCQRRLDNVDAIEAHNLLCSKEGERCYTRIEGIAARTVVTTRTPQGSGTHGREGLS